MWIWALWVYALNPAGCRSTDGRADSEMEQWAKSWDEGHFGPARRVIHP